MLKTRIVKIVELSNLPGFVSIYLKEKESSKTKSNNSIKFNFEFSKEEKT